MQHLSMETLARLVDEAPDGGEATHLEGCPACREELQALQRQTVALATLGQAQPADPPAEHWNAIVAGLSATAGAPPLDDLALRRRPVVPPWLMRAAAAVLLYALGTGTGLVLRGRTPREPASTARPIAAVSQPAERPASTQEPSDVASSPLPETAGPAGSGDTTQPAPDENTQRTRLASDDGTGRLHRLPDPSAARTPEEALQLMAEFEQGYSQAYMRLAELRQQQPLDDPITRIAALESIVLTTGQALDRAPADPVINGYHLTAVAQRDAALRQAALRSDGRWF